MNCKELGYKVGDKFEVIHEEEFRLGEKVCLIKDDGSVSPKFRSLETGEEWHYLLEDVKPLEKTMDIKEAYKIMHENCGIKVGDTVKVLRKAKHGEFGWENTWPSEMDKLIGNEYKVFSLGSYYHDFTIAGYNVPFFVLEKIKDAEPPIKIGDHVVEFTDEGIKVEFTYRKENVGVRIDKETIKKIYDRITR